MIGTDQGRSFKETTFGTSFPFSDHNTFSNFSAYDYRSLPNKSTESDIGNDDFAVNSTFQNFNLFRFT